MDREKRLKQAVHDGVRFAMKHLDCRYAYPQLSLSWGPIYMKDIGDYNAAMLDCGINPPVIRIGLDAVWMVFPGVIRRDIEMQRVLVTFVAAHETTHYVQWLGGAALHSNSETMRDSKTHYADPCEREAHEVAILAIKYIYGATID